MDRTLQLLVCITAAMAVETYGGHHGYVPWYNVQYNDQTVNYSHERMNVRSAERNEDSRISAAGTVPTGGGVRRSYSGSSKILNLTTKPISVTGRSESWSDQVIFPGPTSRKNKPRTSVPKDCLTHGLCANVTGYPVELADRLIANLGDKVKFLTMEQLDNSDLPDITQRIGDPDKNFDLCESTTNIITPETGKDIYQNEHLILNSPTNPIQRFKVETCANPNGNCNSFVCFQNGYSGRCVQRFTYRIMVTIDKKNNTTSEASIKVPTCCSCVAEVV